MATDQQIQEFVNSKIRPFCEDSRDLLRKCENIIAQIDDIYQNLAGSPTWTDANNGNPPHLLTPSDVLAINTFVNDIKTAIANNAQLPIVLKSVVN